MTTTLLRTGLGRVAAGAVLPWAGRAPPANDRWPARGPGSYHCTGARGPRRPRVEGREMATGGTAHEQDRLP